MITKCSAFLLLAGMATILSGEIFQAAEALRTKPIGNRKVVEKMHGLVAFWMFGEGAGQPRVPSGTKQKHPLQEVSGPIARVAGGPFSGYAAELNGKQYFRIPYAETGDLNISGKDAHR